MPAHKNAITDFLKFMAVIITIFTIVYCFGWLIFVAIAWIFTFPGLSILLKTIVGASIGCTAVMLYQEYRESKNTPVRGYSVDDYFDPEEQDGS